MASKDIILITGANTGIGLEAVKAILRSELPYHVLLGSRTPAKADAAIAGLKKEIPETKSIVEALQVDITDDESIGKAVDVVQSKFGKLDVLVNNAGASFDGFFDRDIADARNLFNKTYDVNVSGTQVMTAAFVPLLLKSTSPRLIFLTSGLSTLEGASVTLMPKVTAKIEPGWPKTGLFAAAAYRSSKVALNMVMVAWHSLLKPDGVRTWCISPGFLATGLGGNPEMLKKAGAGDPSLGGDLIKRVIEGERDADVGKVVTQNGEVQPW
ncbi:hypothetical protein AK830_g1257 [Neonectria ditissima]|uniref:Short-chain dehydrogenase/reductase tropE n=1 Tax=Neonectria ditissima TaxID=78410 RepID=A0A0P7BX92_9HYPO|nr:hypothetical protein AK830_g1257 [Neonectria ditissima]